MNAADAAPAAGVHLLLAHDLEDERPKFVELKSRSHRATWLPRGLSGRYGQPEFRTAVDEVLVFEECWRDRIRPYINSPLLLPETAFSAQHSVRDVWSRSRNVSRSRDRLNAVQNAIFRFPIYIGSTALGTTQIRWSLRMLRPRAAVTACCRGRIESSRSISRRGSTSTSRISAVADFRCSIRTGRYTGSATIRISIHTVSCAAAVRVDTERSTAAGRHT